MTSLRDCFATRSGSGRFDILESYSALDVLAGKHSVFFEMHEDPDVGWARHGLIGRRVTGNEPS